MHRPPGQVWYPGPQALHSPCVPTLNPTLPSPSPASPGRSAFSTREPGKGAATALPNPNPYMVITRLLICISREYPRRPSRLPLSAVQTADCPGQLFKCALGSMAHFEGPVLLKGPCSPGKNLAGVWRLDPGGWGRLHFQPWGTYTLWEGAGGPPGRTGWKKLEGFLRSHKLRLLLEARLANIQET